MANNIVFSISKQMFEVLDDIVWYIEGSRVLVKAEWYDMRSVNALIRRELLSVTHRKGHTSIIPTPAGRCLVLQLKTYIRSRR